MYGATALHFAVQRGHTEVVRLLLDNSASFDIRLSYRLTPRDQSGGVPGDTALHIACSKGFTEYVCNNIKSTQEMEREYLHSLNAVNVTRWYIAHS